MGNTGLALYFLIAMVLIALKCLHLINLPWWLVTFPLWSWLVALLVVVLVIVIVYIAKALCELMLS